ncbi:MAG: porin family protein [Alphaproteobacteria bacterium]|nr:porin family protein [Alphaproteobacteria bacterium]
MKIKFFTALSLGIFALSGAAFSANIGDVYGNDQVDRPVRSSTDTMVINNFSYGPPKPRATNVVITQPATVSQPTTANQPITMSSQPTMVAQPAYVQREVYQEQIVPVAVAQNDVRPSVMYRYEEPVSREWYAALKYVHTLASFTSKHYTDGVFCVGGEYCTDEFNFKPMLGFAASAGMNYDAEWRFELEGGYTGEYSTNADDVSFAISAPYLAVNALYNFSGATRSSLYFGPGLGIAFPTTEIHAGGTEIFFLNNTHGNSKERVASPMLALMAGYQWRIDERFALDLGYKLYTFSGTKQSLDFQLTPPAPADIHTFTNKTSWLINNAISLGLRYYF